MHISAPRRDNRLKPSSQIELLGIELTFPTVVAVAHRFLNVLLNFPFPPLDVRPMHRDEDLVQTPHCYVFKVFRERYFREQGQLGLALKMGRDFRIINRIGTLGADSIVFRGS